jgi:hypothetical protein
VRPIQPSLRRQLATFLALSDPRCMADAEHNAIERGHICPKCHLGIHDYERAIPRDWPEA